MSIIAIWDSHYYSSEAVMSVGHTQDEALRKNPLYHAFVEDQQGRYFIMAFARAELDV